MVKHIVRSLGVGLLAMPFITRIVLMFSLISFCISWPFIQNFLGGLCLQPQATVASFQIYRMLTYLVVHPNSLHLIFNMLVFVSIAKRIEGQVGSIVFLGMLTSFTVLVAVGVITYTIVVTFGLGMSESFYTTCVSGASGVLFALVVVYAMKFSASDSVKILGKIPVPYSVVPFVLFGLSQLLPEASALAPVVGLVLGYAYVHGLLAPFFPGKQWALRIEGTGFLQSYKERNGFVSANDDAGTSTLPTFHNDSLRNSMPGPATPAKPPMSPVPF